MCSERSAWAAEMTALSLRSAQAMVASGLPSMNSEDLLAVTDSQERGECLNPCVSSTVSSH